MPGEEFAEGGGPAAIRDLGMLLLYCIIKNSLNHLNQFDVSCDLTRKTKQSNLIYLFYLFRDTPSFEN